MIPWHIAVLLCLASASFSCATTCLLIARWLAKHEGRVGYTLHFRQSHLLPIDPLKPRVVKRARREPA